MNGALTVWTIYWGPEHARDKTLARRWEVDENGAQPTSDLVRASLEELRHLFWARGFIRLQRNVNDSEFVVENWA